MMAPEVGVFPSPPFVLCRVFLALFVSPGSAEMAELRGMLLKQQKQIDQLTNSLSMLQVPTRPYRSSCLSPVICRLCQKPGHYARECDNERVTPVQNPAPQSRRQGDSNCASQTGN